MLSMTLILSMMLSIFNFFLGCPVGGGTRFLETGVGHANAPLWKGCLIVLAYFAPRGSWQFSARFHARNIVENFSFMDPMHGIFPPGECSRPTLSRLRDLWSRNSDQAWRADQSWNPFVPCPFYRFSHRVYLSCSNIRYPCADETKSDDK